MEWLGIIGPVTALLGVVGAIFNFSVIQPLNASIRNLNDSIENMKESLHDIDEKRQVQAERLATVESSVKSAHHRLDEIAQRLNE